MPDTTSTFDPFSDILEAQAERPEAWTNVSPSALTPLQRSLLVTDGTVTKLLEAHHAEPVAIETLRQDTMRLSADDGWLDACAGAAVINREVALRGARSGRVYVWAETLLVADRLPDSVRAGLQANPGGLGRILSESRLETRREILWWGVEEPGTLPGQIDPLGPRFLARTYRVMHAGVVLMLITERFPWLT